jgi:hypothetical protein
MAPSGVGWPVPQYGLGLFLGDLPQVCLPVRLVLVRGPGDRSGLLLSHCGLDDVVPSLGHHPERTRDIRWIYLHMIEEYARHNGHADLIRERIDGVTGA